jgi:succinate dehydrogenase / fumarate reductase, iron-sulfur subunit
MITLSIYRFDPEQDSKPYMKDIEVDRDACQGIMLLDALEAAKRKDPSIAFRRSCGGGVCGSDGMNINGKNGLACQTPLAGLPDKVVLRPLPGMPVIRDLIVDFDHFFKQYESVDPFLRPLKELPSKELKQTVAARQELDGLYECILCACCTSSCPSYWWNPDQFVGPAGLLWACRFILDSRDMTQKQRLEDLQGLYRLYRCRSIMNCTDVCPKGLNPNEAILNIHKKMLAPEQETTR